MKVANNWTKLSTSYHSSYILCINGYLIRYDMNYIK